MKITNPDCVSIILNLISRDHLRNKQTIILHNCLNNNEKYVLAITPHRKSVGYIRTKRQTLRKKIINQQKKNY